MEMEVRDDGATGPSRLGYYKHQTASFCYSKHNTFMCASPAPAYDVRA